MLSGRRKNNVTIEKIEVFEENRLFRGDDFSYRQRANYLGLLNSFRWPATPHFEHGQFDNALGRVARASRLTTTRPSITSRNGRRFSPART
jgi:hypothetical protein